MAAPAVAGVAAQVIQKTKNSDPAFVWSMIKGGATPGVLTSPYFGGSSPDLVAFETNLRLVRSVSQETVEPAPLTDDYAQPAYRTNFGGNLVELTLVPDQFMLSEVSPPPACARGPCTTARARNSAPRAALP